MTPEELDEATVEEAKRRWLSTPALRIHGTLGGDVPFIAARLARENWTPPEPVDPDILAFREFASKEAISWNNASLAEAYLNGDMDSGASARLFLAGARMAREQERERAKVLVEYLEEDRGIPAHAWRLAKYRGEA